MSPAAEVEVEGRLSPLFTWRSAICDSDLPPTVRHVALTLSLHMSERGDSCFPSRQVLALETGLSERAVQRAIKALEEGGWLRVERPAERGGRGHPNRYAARVPEGRPWFSLPRQKGERGSPKDVNIYISTLSHRGNGDISSPLPPRSRRRGDPLFEAVYEATAGQPWSLGASLTRTARAALNAAVRDLREVGATPDDVRRAAAAWPAVFPQARCTPHALAKHWHLLAAAREQEPPPLSDAERAEVARLRELYAREEQAWLVGGAS